MDFVALILWLAIGFLAWIVFEVTKQAKRAKRPRTKLKYDAQGRLDTSSYFKGISEQEKPLKEVNNEEGSVPSFTTGPPPRAESNFKPESATHEKCSRKDEISEFSSGLGIVKPPIEWRPEITDEGEILVDANWKFFIEASSQKPQEFYIYSVIGFPELLKAGKSKKASKRKENYYGECLYSTKGSSVFIGLLEQIFLHSTYHRAHWKPPSFGVGNTDTETYNPSLKRFEAQYGEPPGSSEIREMTLTEAKATVARITALLRKGEAHKCFAEFTIREQNGQRGFRNQMLIPNEPIHFDFEIEETTPIEKKIEAPIAERLSIEFSVSLGTDDSPSLFEEFKSMENEGTEYFRFSPWLGWNVPLKYLEARHKKLSKSDLYNLISAEENGRYGSFSDWDLHTLYEGYREHSEERKRHEDYEDQYCETIKYGREVIEKEYPIEREKGRVMQTLQSIRVTSDAYLHFRAAEDNSWRPFLYPEKERSEYIQEQSKMFLAEYIQSLEGFPLLSKEQDAYLDQLREDLPTDLADGIFEERITVVKGVGEKNAALLRNNGFDVLADLHTTTERELCKVNGIGPKTAKLIKTIFS